MHHPLFQLRGRREIPRDTPWKSSFRRLRRGGLLVPPQDPRRRRWMRREDDMGVYVTSDCKLHELAQGRFAIWKKRGKSHTVGTCWHSANRSVKGKLSGWTLHSGPLSFAGFCWVSWRLESNCCNTPPSLDFLEYIWSTLSQSAIFLCLLSFFLSRFPKVSCNLRCPQYTVGETRFPHTWSKSRCKGWSRFTNTDQIASSSAAEISSADRWMWITSDRDTIFLGMYHFNVKKGPPLNPDLSTAHILDF